MASASGPENQKGELTGVSGGTFFSRGLRRALLSAAEPPRSAKVQWDICEQRSRGVFSP